MTTGCTPSTGRPLDRRTGQPRMNRTCRYSSSQRSWVTSGDEEKPVRDLNEATGEA